MCVLFPGSLCFYASAPDRVDRHHKEHTRATWSDVELGTSCTQVQINQKEQDIQHSDAADNRAADTNYDDQDTEHRAWASNRLVDKCL